MDGGVWIFFHVAVLASMEFAIIASTQDTESVVNTIRQRNISRSLTQSRHGY